MCSGYGAIPPVVALSAATFSSKQDSVECIMLVVDRDRDLIELLSRIEELCLLIRFVQQYKPFMRPGETIPPSIGAPR